MFAFKEKVCTVNLQHTAVQCKNESRIEVQCVSY